MTQVLAIYGAVVGTASLFWNLYTGLRDRPRITVFAGPDDPARADLRAPNDTDPRFLVHVQNRGRRPVAIERVWYSLLSTGAAKHLLTDRHDRGTQFVAEGESHTFELSIRDVRPDDVDGIVVETQDGRKWTGRYDRSAQPISWHQLDQPPRNSPKERLK